VLNFIRFSTKKWQVIKALDSSKNTTPGRPRASNRGRSENRTIDQEIEVEAMEEGKINDEAVEEVVMEDMDYAELKNKFAKRKKRVVGETGPELSQKRN
jgi:hypothetical protein